MRRLLIFLLLAILSIAGCATTGTETVKEDYKIPNYIRNRPIQLIHRRLLMCYGIWPTIIPISIVKAKEPAAWATEDGVFLTEGIFQFDDRTISFVLAHELAHVKLDHLKKHNEKSAEISNVMSGFGTIIPGMSLLNLVVNPAIMKQYSKAQEWEADDLASKTAERCLGITREQQARAYEKLTNTGSEGGGFWDEHPAWKERIDRIRNGPPH